MPTEKSKLKVVEGLAKELLGHLGEKAEVKASQGEEGLIELQLNTNEPGVLIGYHGETLLAIQLMISMMAYRKLGEWTRVLVNVNDYREKRKEALERMALVAAQKAKFSGQSQALLPMSSWERRVVHLALASDPEVETLSEGEGEERRVVVSPVRIH